MKSLAPFFLKSWSKINSNCRSCPSRSSANWVWVHSVNVIVRKVHNNNLRVACFTSWSDLFPDKFRGNFTVIWREMIGEAVLIVMISFPNHAFSSWMSSIIFPIFIIVNIQFGLWIFNKSVSVIHTWSNTQINRACSVSSV